MKLSYHSNIDMHKISKGLTVLNTLTTPNIYHTDWYVLRLAMTETESGLELATRTEQYANMTSGDTEICVRIIFCQIFTNTMYLAAIKHGKIVLIIF